jgi:very-short-patch-repair endonuclease
MGGELDSHGHDEGDCRVVGGAASRERQVAELAARQYGVVTRAQLLAVGLGRRAIDLRLRAGRLHPVHRGVYLVGHTTAPRYAREMAAVLACGPGSVLSHLSAAHVWALLRCPAHDCDVDVSVCGRNPGRKPGIRVHRVGKLAAADVHKGARIPITTPARTLLDLAASGTIRDLERACAEAQARRLVGQREVVALLDRHRHGSGTAALRRMTDTDAAPPLTRSEAERRFLELVRAAQLPPPEVNVRVGRHEVDFLWREPGVVVEVDGFDFHSSRAAFERDRLRDTELGALGYRVMRVTWRQIVHRPHAMLVRIAQALAVASPG